MILFFDTETSGLTNFRLPVDHPDQPHIVQLAAVLCDDDPLCTVQSTFCAFIKPDGWYVQDDAFNVHGISTDYCVRFGEELRSVLWTFATLVDTACASPTPARLVGHNVEFDVRMVLREAYGLADFDPTFISRPQPFCTMRAMTPICRLPHPRFRAQQFKWPKLEEAYRFLFNTYFEGAHGALQDALACRDVFVEGRRRAWWR